jgi:WD40 repeat protein
MLGFTPDGKRLLSFGDDFCLRSWDVTTGKAVVEYVIRPSDVKGLTDNVTEALEKGGWPDATCAGMFSPDGKLLIVSFADSLFLFDVATGKELRKISLAGRNALHLAVSPDNTLLAASALGDDVTTKEHLAWLWDSASGQLVRQIQLPDRGPGPVSFSRDGTVLAVAVKKPRPGIHFWDLATGNELDFFVEGYRGEVRRLAFSPDGKQVVSGMSDTTCLVWDVTGLAKRRR